MLKKCTEPEFEKYVDFIYELALVPSKSGYPTYNDGIKTKEMFLERSRKAFSENTEDILLFEHNGNVEGWIHYYWIPEDHYLSTVSFNINLAAEEALQEFLDFAGKKFGGYDLYLGYPAENKNAVDFLSANGFECIEEDYNNTAFLENIECVEENYKDAAFGGNFECIEEDCNHTAFLKKFDCKEKDFNNAVSAKKCKIKSTSDGIVLITKENYAYFRKLHTQQEGDMYWNSDRIYADLEHWVLLVQLANGEPVGAVYYMNAETDWFEIFGIDMKDGAYDSDLFGELIRAALNDAKRRGGKFMTFFCEEEGEEIVKKSGFICVGKYVCYKACLGK